MAKINYKLSTKLKTTKNYFIIRFKHIVVSSSFHVMYIHIHVIYVNNLCSDFNYLSCSPSTAALYATQEKGCKQKDCNLPEFLTGCFKKGGGQICFGLYKSLLLNSKSKNTLQVTAPRSFCDPIYL